jgi:hypothetical protein
VVVDLHPDDSVDVRDVPPALELVVGVDALDDGRLDLVVVGERSRWRMTSNRPLEDWGKLLGDVPSATAILVPGAIARRMAWGCWSFSSGAKT